MKSKVTDTPEETAERMADPHGVTKAERERAIALMNKTGEKEVKGGVARSPRYKVTLTISAKTITTAKKMMSLYPELTPHVEKIERGQSRADRLSEAIESLEDAKSVVEELKDEMREWFDNMPENLQGSDKGTSVEEAADELERLYDELESVDMSSVDFPSMF